MKKISLLVLLYAGIVTTSVAQEQRDAGRLQAYKIAFLTRKLSLTPEEAQKFWPIYNKYEGELRAARIEGRTTKKEIETEEKILNIRKKYSTEFTKAISEEKVNQLFKAEREFSTIVQKEFLERRNQRRQRK